MVTRRNVLNFITMSISGLSMHSLTGCGGTRRSDPLDAFPVSWYLNGTPVRRVQLNDINKFEQAFSNQKMSQWCWAACIANCFTFHNHPIDQETIVRTVYGQIVNLPSMTAMRIAEQLNRKWIDRYGQVFTARLTGAYDYFAGYNSMSNSFMIRQIIAGNPLIYTNQSHAMVVTAVDYLPNQQVVGLMVFDPMPGSPRHVHLTGQDIAIGEIGGNMRFMAAFTVS